MFKKENIIGFMLGIIIYVAISLILYLLGIHNLAIKLVSVVVIAMLVDYAIKHYKKK